MKKFILSLLVIPLGLEPRTSALEENESVECKVLSVVLLINLWCGYRRDVVFCYRNYCSGNK